VSGEKRDLPAEIEEAEAQLAALERARDQAFVQVTQLRRAQLVASEPPQLRLPTVPAVPVPRSRTDKIRLFRSLFRGRTDVFPKRWENVKQARSGYAPACANEWVRGVCEKPRVKCGECPHQALISVDDRVIDDHLGGKHTAGVYPLLPDDTCWFVAVDFDDESWMDDVAAFAEAARAHGLSPAVERSRSGNGAHVWFLFASPVAAQEGRNMASFVLTETMRLRRELKLRSYDRLFPSQDTLPQGGFGNLIALPSTDSRPIESEPSPRKRFEQRGCWRFPHPPTTRGGDEDEAPSGRLRESKRPSCPSPCRL